jgi:hypothetical protein
MLNPAAAADNPLKADLMLLGFELSLNNSWFSIKQEALKYEGRLIQPSGWKFPDTWKNFTPGVEQNIFKNFVPVGTAGSHSVIIENRLTLPSLMYRIDNRQAVAFLWNRRQIGNLDGLSKEVASLFEQELDLSVLRNNNVKNEKLRAIQMSWVEYGLCYARVLLNKKTHFVKAGITPKLVQGLESAYVVLNDLDLLLSTKDTLSHIDASFTYARSENSGSAFSVNRTVGGLAGNGIFPALDLGVIYEWRPSRLQSQKTPWNSAYTKYRIRAGASVNDIGQISFKKGGRYYDLDISFREANVTRYTTITKLHELDSLLKLDFPESTGPNEYSVFLPAAFNAFVDAAVYKYVYVNLTAHIADLYRGTDWRVHDYNMVRLAPRFECLWFDFSLPVTWNALSASRGKPFTAGIALRAGPLTIGTNDLQPYTKGDISSLNFFFTLRAFLPHAKLRDRDADGVNDKMDACPDDSGSRAANGCPDKDGDGVSDREDACPNQPGTLQNRGCATSPEK